MKPHEAYYKGQAMRVCQLLAATREDLITEDIRDMLSDEGIQPIKNQSVMSGVMGWATGKKSGPLLVKTDRVRKPASRARRQQRHDELPIYRSLVVGRPLASLPPLPALAKMPKPATFFDLLEEMEKDAQPEPVLV